MQKHFQIFGSFCVGGSIVIIDDNVKKIPEKLTTICNIYGITRLGFSPERYKYFLNEIDEKKLKQSIQQNPDHIVTLFGVKTASSNFSFKISWGIFPPKHPDRAIMPSLYFSKSSVSILGL